MKNHQNWMGNLLDKKSPIAEQPINKILIPGTHDSGTYGMDYLGQTQSLTIPQQLNNGVRYFDCRISHSYGSYYLYHTFDSPNKFVSPGDTPAANQDNVLYGIRTFLIDNPKEILILKFQNFDGFSQDDYWNFIQLIRAYVEFDTLGPHKSNCNLVTLAHGTALDIGKESIKTLNSKNMRVFLFFEIKDVPTDPVIAKKIWDQAFQYSPLLHKGSFGLWDPYWGDSGSGISVNDSTEAGMDTWWQWHETNRRTWMAAGDNAGFYVLQSHMQQLPGSPSYESIYYNISEQAADGNYYMNQNPQTGDFLSNNNRNIQHYIDNVKQGAAYNIIMFDYIQDGDVCTEIVNYYNNIKPTPQPITFQQRIILKLNALTRYIGTGLADHQYHYPRLKPDPVQLYIKNPAKETDNRVIRDGDEILICTTEDTYDGRDRLSAYGTNELYYYTGNSDHERWIIRNGSIGSEIKTGDYVTFENKSYSGQFLTPYGIYVSTKKGTPATRWIINM
jgi:hypothetical protein